MQIRVMSWNILNGGAGPVPGDGEVADSRWALQRTLIDDLAPDVLLVQELRGVDADGSHGLFAAERDLGMRGLLAAAPRTGQHTAVFVRAPLRALSFHPDGDHFHHALAHAVLQVPGLARPLQVASMHLSPLSPALRAAEVGWLAAFGAAGVLGLVAGDTNSLAPGDPEPDDWESLPAFQRVRYLANPDNDDVPGGGALRADRSALRFLHAAGLVDAARGRRDDTAGRLMDGTVDTTATVPTCGYPDAEFASFRSDHVLLSPALAPARSRYTVVQDDRAHATSDHLPVVVDLDLDLLAGAAASTDAIG
jgi:exodeoxyribonuclease-3